MKTPSKPLKHQSKDPDWQAVNELAFIYYQDQTNKDKRKALYDELTRDRYTTKKVRGKEQQVREPSLLLKFARDIVSKMRKADLGAGVTDLTKEILDEALERKDPISGLPIFRETGLLGGFFSKQEIDQDGKVTESLAWTPGKFDPERGAFNTFFKQIVCSELLDYARKYNNARKKNMGLKEGLRPLPNAQDTDNELRDQTPEELAIYGAGRRKDAAVQVDYEAFELWVNREYEEFSDDDEQEEEDLTEPKEALKQLLKGHADDLRDVAMQMALVRWTGEDDQDIQKRLGLTTKQFNPLKAKALPLIEPFVKKWWLEGVPNFV